MTCTCVTTAPMSPNFPPAFMRMPPPIVPGMPARHSMPAKPWRHGAEHQLLHIDARADFDGVLVVLHAPPVFVIETKDRAVDALIAHQQIRAQPQHVDRNVILDAAARRLLQLLDSPRADEATAPARRSCTRCAAPAARSP